MVGCGNSTQQAIVHVHLPPTESVLIWFAVGMAEASRNREGGTDAILLTLFSPFKSSCFCVPQRTIAPGSLYIMWTHRRQSDIIRFTVTMGQACWNREECINTTLHGNPCRSSGCLASCLTLLTGQGLWLVARSDLPLVSVDLIVKSSQPSSALPCLA